MKPADLQKLIAAQRRSAAPLDPEDKDRGFKGWYFSKRLPHFDAPGVQQYVTFRLADSLPAARRTEWEVILALEDDREKQRRLERYLDLGLGACHLRRPDVADLVQQAMWHFDGLRYRLLAWVVMPNHIHALMEVLNTPLGKVLKDLKSYTSKCANRLLGREGAFWGHDYFDRRIRNLEHYQRVVRYIEGNPVKAGLALTPAEWRWSSAFYRGQEGTSVLTLAHPSASRLAHEG